MAAIVDAEIDLDSAAFGASVPDASNAGWGLFSAGDCFMLWAVRQWTIAMRGHPAVAGEIYDTFEFHGALDALRPMNRFMTAILVGRYRDLAINSPLTPEMTVDEAAILRALALAQAGHADLCETRMMTWLPRTVARVALPHARRLARLLGERGLRLTLDGSQRQ